MYVTLDENADAPAALLDGPGPVQAEPGTDDELRSALAEPYLVPAWARTIYYADGFVKLSDALPAPVVARRALQLELLLVAAHGQQTQGRFPALEQMWVTDPVMRAVALSPRLAGIAADLLGTEGVRRYHDNALSKNPVAAGPPGTTTPSTSPTPHRP